MAKTEKHQQRYYPALQDYPLPNMRTDALAYYSGFREDTWRDRARKGTGPIQPIRVLGQLRWRTDDVRDLLGVPRISQEAVAAYGVGFLHGRQGAEPVHPIEQEHVGATSPSSPVVLTDENPDDFDGERFYNYTPPVREGVVVKPVPQDAEPAEGGAA